MSKSGFLVAVLWLCAAGALWLLVSPAAFKRRALMRRVELLEQSVHSEWARNIGWERWRDGLAGDPSMIEREARKLGYGRPGELRYRVTANATSNVIPADSGSNERFSWLSEIGQSVAPVLMLIIVGAIAVPFFAGLKVEDPGARRHEPGPDSQESA